MTIQEIKALPRTEEGIFDLKKVQADAGRRNIYQAADLYIQHMRHMRPPRIKRKDIRISWRRCVC